MLKFSTTVAVAAGLMVTGLTTDRADAMPLGDPSAIRSAVIDRNIIDNVQYVWGGRRHCWYDSAWYGPGWYWCGYAWRRGFGWGGPVGWRGWGRPVGRVGVGRVGRVGVGRVGRTGAGRVGRTGAGRVGRTGAGRVGRTGGRVGRGGGGGARVGGGGGRGGGGGARVGGGGGRGGGGGGGGGNRRSDIMVKHDIALLGHLDNGLGFYRFSYTGSNKAYVGVMAQDVQLVMPNAVVRGSDGYLRVYYDTLGVKFQTYDEWVASGARVPAGAPIRH